MNKSQSDVFLMCKGHFVDKGVDPEAGERR
jgi:hypothetical protein